MNTNVKIVLCSVLLNFTIQSMWAGDELRDLSQTRSQSVASSVQCEAEGLFEILRDQMGQYIQLVENSPTSEDAVMLQNFLGSYEAYQDASSKLESALRFVNRIGSIPRDRRSQGLQVGDRVRSALGHDIRVNVGNSPFQSSASSMSSRAPSSASNRNFSPELGSRASSPFEGDKKTPPSSTRSSRRDVQNPASQPPSYDSPQNSPKSFSSGRTTPESSRVVYKSSLVTDAISSGSTPLSSFRSQTNDEHKLIDKKTPINHEKSDTSSEEEDSSLGHSSAEMVQQAEEEDAIDYASLLAEEKVIEEEFYTYPDIHEKECRDKGIEHLEDHATDRPCNCGYEHCKGVIFQLKRLRDLSNKKTVYADNISSEFNDIKIVFDVKNDHKKLLNFFEKNNISIHQKLSNMLTEVSFLGAIIIEEYQGKQCAFLASVEINGKLKHSANAFVKQYSQLDINDQEKLVSLSMQNIDFISHSEWPDLSLIFKISLARLEISNCKLKRFTYNIHALDGMKPYMSELIIRNNTLEDKIYFDKFFRDHLNHFVHLYWLDLSSNKLHGIFDGESKFLHELLYANFSNNELTRNSKGEYWIKQSYKSGGDSDCALNKMDQSKYLKYLDFTNNPIASDKFLHGGMLANLEYLGLCGAHINEFVCDPLNTEKKLVIDVSGNSVANAKCPTEGVIAKCFPKLKGIVCVDMVNARCAERNFVPAELRFNLKKCENLEFAVFKLHQIYSVTEKLKVYIMGTDSKITDLSTDQNIERLECPLVFKRPAMKYENTLLQYLIEKPRISNSKKK